MPHDEAKRAILARRSRFLAAAVASVGIVSGCEKQAAPPVNCLTPIADDASVEDDTKPSTGIHARPPTPMPCLEPMAPEDPANPSGIEKDAGPQPQVCLTKFKMEDS